MKQFLLNNTKLQIKNKIEIPQRFKHVRLDIGLSYFASMSQYWLSHDKELIVFGFEPNLDALSDLLNGVNHGCRDSLDTKLIGDSFFAVPCALGLSNEKFAKFYYTKNDPSQSSLYFTKHFEIKKTENVPIFPLSEFFDLFPFDTHPVIEYMKIDAQGSDLDIVKSAGPYLSKIVFVTLEAENFYYENTDNSCQSIVEYMYSAGFLLCNSGTTEDPTFINKEFINYASDHKIVPFQKG